MAQLYRQLKKIDDKAKVCFLTADDMNYYQSTNEFNGEGYSKLKQIVNENVKVVLSEKRVLISISFAAVIQTLKADTQMIKLIQNIAGANDDKQHKDNKNYIIKYLEFNKDNLLDQPKRITKILQTL